MNRILLLLIIIIMGGNTFASKVTPGTFVRKQADGTTVKVRGYGDEFFSYFSTPDGVLLSRQKDGFYVALVTEEGMLVSSGVLAHDRGMRTAEELELIGKQDKALFFGQAEVNAMKAKERTFGKLTPYYDDCPPYLPSLGTVRVPVVLVQFPDMKFTATKEELYEIYMSEEVKPYEPNTEAFLRNYGSAHQFFKDASLGKLDLQLEFYGPYTMPHEHDYYGYAAGNSGTKVLVDALTLADPDIDFSQYDNDGDGVCDLIHFLHAGTGANQSAEGTDNDIWASTWYSYIKGGLIYYDDIGINRYGISSEILASPGNSFTSDGRALYTGIGIFCHETSHSMGLPDLYYTSTSWPTLDNNGPEDWDLMDNGENIRNGYWPILHSAWERILFDWVDPVELTEPQEVTIWPLNDPEGRGKAYVIRNPYYENEYWTLENIPSEGWYTGVYGAGTGIVITHINYVDELFNSLGSRPNSFYGAPNCTIVPADGYITSSYYRNDNNADGVFITNEMYREDLRGDTYPGSMHVTELAAYKNYYGEGDLVEMLPITDIRRNDDGSVTLNFGGYESAIRTVGVDSGEGSSAVYTLDGRRVAADDASHGVFVSNGKKFIK